MAIFMAIEKKYECHILKRSHSCPSPMLFVVSVLLVEIFVFSHSFVICWTCLSFVLFDFVV